MLPDFVVIGAQKSGTKWLYHNLDRHPKVFLPPGFGLEVHYFDDDSVYSNVKWYSEHYWDVPGKTVRGDITPDYARIPIERIQHAKEILPNAKLIYTLRNPKDRAVSHLRMIFKKTALGYPNEKPGPQILATDPLPTMLEFIQHGEASQHCDYVGNLRRWRSVFPPEQLLVVSYDELVRDPQRYLSRIMDHIGLEGPVDLQYPLYDRFHVSVPYHMDPGLAPELDRIFNPQIEALRSEVDFDITGWLSSSTLS